MKYTTLLFLLLLSMGATGQTAPDSLPAFRNFRKPYTEKAYKLLLGFNWQGSPRGDTAKTLRYAEIGLHRTFTGFDGRHPPISWTYGLSTEILLHKNPVYGFKASAWATAFLFAAGISAVYYTDFHYGNFKIRPELGLGMYPFKLTFGYNIPTFFNKDFERLRKNDLQITLNILLKIKTIERK